MKIDLNSLIGTSERNEPSREDLAPFVSKAGAIFSACGLRETELVKKVVPYFGRVLFDIGDSSLNTWSNGKPLVDPTGYEPATKGLLMAGGVGVGKTTIMRVMAASIHGEYITVPALATTFSKHGADGFWNAVNRAEHWDLFLDDLGAEDDVKSYANILPIKELIYQRYDLWQRKGVRTHVSTNCIGDQIETRYGVRIRDRLREMMVLAVGTGDSLRK